MKSQRDWLRIAWGSRLGALLISDGLETSDANSGSSGVVVPGSRRNNP